MAKSEFFYLKGSGGMQACDSAEEALAKTVEGGFVWLSYIQPSIEELKILTEELKIHPLSIKDCFDDKQIPKVDNFPDYTHVLFNSFDYTNNELKVEEVNLFLGEKFIVSVGQQPSEKHHLMNQLRPIIEMEMDKVSEGPSYVMHEILDNIVDQKLEAIEAIEDDLIAAEDIMLENSTEFDVGSLQRIRRVLLVLRKSLISEREILVKICRKDSRFIPDAAIYHYSDIYDHLNKFVELTESNRETLTSLIQMNLTLLNNQMSRASNQTNKFVRRLTFITTIFMPLTLLTGIGGMSEYTMATGSSNWRAAYLILLAVMLLIGILNYYGLKWLGRNDEKPD